MECDTMHSLIERKAKHKEVYTPGGYVTLAKNVCATPFKVKELGHEDFIDWEIINEQGCKTNAFTGIASMHHIEYSYQPVGNVEVRMHKEIGNEGQACEYKKRGRPYNFTTNQLRKAYPEQIKINAKKKADLLNLCKYMPRDTKTYYESQEV
jgi:hypothetical protein